MSEEAKVAKAPGAGQVAAVAKNDLKSLLQGEDFKKAVALALPTHLKPDRFVRVAITAIMRAPLLAKCDQTSFFNSLMILSQFGLEPDGRRAHLIPFRNNKRSEREGKEVIECQLIIDYKGFVEMMYRSPKVGLISSDVVCENDIFHYDKKQVVEHKIDFRKARGEVYAAWATIKMTNGLEVADCMNRQEIEAIRSRSKAGKSGPWVTDWNEMAKKTVLRRLSKMIPWPSEIAEAINADDDRPVNLRGTGPVIEIPGNLITDGSDKAQPEDDEPEAGKPNTGAANLVDKLKAKPAPKPDGLTEAEKQSIIDQEAADAAKERKAGELL
jgi:recombination protein RecT